MKKIIVAVVILFMSYVAYLPENSPLGLKIGFITLQEQESTSEIDEGTEGPDISVNNCMSIAAAETRGWPVASAVTYQGICGDDSSYVKFSPLLFILNGLLLSSPLALPFLLIDRFVVPKPRNQKGNK